MASDTDLLKDDDIQQLLAQAQAGLTGSPAPITPPPAAAAPKVQNSIGAGELEALLSGGGNMAEPVAPTRATTTAAPKAKSASPRSSTSRRAEQLLDQVESGIEQAMREDRRGRPSSKPDVSGATPFQYSEFESPSGNSGRSYSLGTLDDVELDLQIELGRAELLIDEVLALREGAVVPLDKMAGDPVDIVVNGRLLARGEVLVLNDNFCVRVAEIVAPDF